MAGSRDKKTQMTAMQKRFVEFYLEVLNATQAYILANPRSNKKTAGISGHLLMRNSNVRSAIEKRIDERSAKSENTQQRILDELKAIAFSDIRKIFTDKNDLKKIHDLDNETAAAVSSIDVEDSHVGKGKFATTKKVKLHDKMRALQMLGKHHGMFKENEASAEDVVKALKELAQGLPD